MRSFSVARKTLSSEKSHLLILQPKILLLPRLTSHYPNSPPATSKSAIPQCPNTKPPSHRQQKFRRAWHSGGQRQTSSRHGWCSASNKMPTSESSALPMFSAICGRKDGRPHPHLPPHHRRLFILHSARTLHACHPPHPHHLQVCSLFSLWISLLAYFLDLEHHRLRISLLPFHGGLNSHVLHTPSEYDCISLKLRSTMPVHLLELYKIRLQRPNNISSPSHQ
jgi:hypothetical protein